MFKVEKSPGVSRVIKVSGLKKNKKAFPREPEHADLVHPSLPLSPLFSSNLHPSSPMLRETHAPTSRLACFTLHDCTRSLGQTRIGHDYAWPESPSRCCQKGTYLPIAVIIAPRIPAPLKWSECSPTVVGPRVDGILYALFGEASSPTGHAQEADGYCR